MCRNTRGCPAGRTRRETVGNRRKNGNRKTKTGKREPKTHAGKRRKRVPIFVVISTFACRQVDLRPPKARKPSGPTSCERSSLRRRPARFDDPSNEAQQQSGRSPDWPRRTWRRPWIARWKACLAWACRTSCSRLRRGRRLRALPPARQCILSKCILNQCAR